MRIFTFRTVTFRDRKFQDPSLQYCPVSGSLISGRPISTILTLLGQLIYLKTHLNEVSLYPGPHSRDLLRSFPVPSGKTPTGGFRRKPTSSIALITHLNIKYESSGFPSDNPSYGQNYCKTPLRMSHRIFREVTLVMIFNHQSI